MVQRSAAAGTKPVAVSFQSMSASHSDDMMKLSGAPVLR